MPLHMFLGRRFHDGDMMYSTSISFGSCRHGENKPTYALLLATRSTLAISDSYFLDSHAICLFCAITLFVAITIISFSARSCTALCTVANAGERASSLRHRILAQAHLIAVRCDGPPLATGPHGPSSVYVSHACRIGVSYLFVNRNSLSLLFI
jgi:hypothetical protein